MWSYTRQQYMYTCTELGMEDCYCATHQHPFSVARLHAVAVGHLLRTRRSRASLRPRSPSLDSRGCCTSQSCCWSSDATHFPPASTTRVARPNCDRTENKSTTMYEQMCYRSVDNEWRLYLAWGRTIASPITVNIRAKPTGVQTRSDTNIIVHI